MKKAGLIIAATVATLLTTGCPHPKHSPQPAAQHHSADSGSIYHHKNKVENRKKHWANATEETHGAKEKTKKAAEETVEAAKSAW